ncbi:MAG: DUF420 domain-containing protein, partial [Vicinamibacterales bacterium]|nr:DUF420 domain-containing protein [Vicinamibacterales bacterium]
MLDVTTLPAVNATLNSLAAVLLATGYVLVRRGRVRQHRLCMLAAFTTSVLFLVSYLVYHAQVGSQPFTGLGPVRIVYFTVLISHITLAAIIVPLALVTLRRGLRRNDARHVAIARWTLPIW